MAVQVSDSLTHHPHSGKPWVCDTGAAQHICGDASVLVDYAPYQPHEVPFRWRTSDGTIAKASGRAKARINFLLNDGSTNEIIIDCVYAPQSFYNLYSTGQGLRDLGIGYNDYKMTLHDVANEEAIIGYSYRHNQVAFLKTAPIPTNGLPSINAAITPELAHRRLAHAGKPKARANQTRLGIDNVEGSDSFDCEACHQGKAKKIISHTPQVRTKRAFEMVHLDLQPVKPKGINGVNHVLVITDDATRCRFVFFLKEKSDASGVLINWAKVIHNVCDRWPIIWRCDGGTEFNHFITWACSNGQTVEKSVPYAHEQNGVSEYTGYLVVQTARTMIIDAKAPDYLWPEAVNTATYVLNRLRKPGDDKSPVERWREDLGIKGDIDSLAFLRA
jgi:hypothetical protein